MFSARSFPVIVLVFASVLWGLSWLPLKYLEQVGFNGISLLLISQAILAIIFLPLGFRGALILTHYRSLIAISIAGGGAILCFTYALMYGDIIRVMVLFYLLPVWGVLGGWLLLGERPDLIRWCGVVLALLGAFLLLGGTKAFSSSLSWLDVLALSSGLCFALNNIVFRGVPDLPLPTKLLAMFLGCALISGLLVIANVQPLPHGVPLAHWGWLVGYTLCWLMVANIGSQWAVTQMEAGRSSIIIIVELVVAVISALVIAGERLMPVEWVGCSMVVIAAVLEAIRVEDVNVDRIEKTPEMWR